MAAKLLGLLSFLLATSAVTCVFYHRNSFGLGKDKFHHQSSEEKWINFNRLHPTYHFQPNRLSHLPYEFDLSDLLNHLESSETYSGMRIPVKPLFDDRWFRSRNNKHSTATPLIMKLKLSSDKRPFKITSDSLDKKTVNTVNVASDKEANADLNASIKETDVNTVKVLTNHPRLSFSTPHTLFNSEITSFISSKSSKIANSNLNLQSLEKRNSFTQELATDSNLQATETSGGSNFISSLMPQLASKNDGISQNPSDESSISEIPQSKNNERNFSRYVFQKSSESNQASPTHSVLSTETSDGFFKNPISSHPQRESFTNDIYSTDTTDIYSTDIHSTDMHSTDTPDIYSTDMHSTDTTDMYSTDMYSTDIHSTDMHSTDTPDIHSSDTTDMYSTDMHSTDTSDIHSAETTGMLSTDIHSADTSDIYSTDTTDMHFTDTTDFNPSIGTTKDKENSSIFIKSTTVHGIAHNTAKIVANLVKSGISVSTNPRFFKEKLVKETIPLDHVINISAIRTARIVISVVFLSIALMAIAVLSIYLFKIRRNSVQYDQLLLLP